jgi:hypothetical protein
MDKLTTLVSFLAALSVATERITEIFKSLPLLSKWFAVEKKDPTLEELRKASVQFVAVLSGTLVTYLAGAQLSQQFGVSNMHWYVYWVFGAMASGGSGIWNSVLEIVREVSLQKQIATDKLKGLPAAN